MKGPSNILTRFILKWKLLSWLEVLTITGAVAGAGYILLNESVWVIGMAAFTCIIAIFLIKPWQVSYKHAVAILDSKYQSAEYSSGLLLEPISELSTIAKLQRNKVEQDLSQKRLVPPHRLWAFFMVTVILLGGSWLIDHLILEEYSKNMGKEKVNKQIGLEFHANDSLTSKPVKPVNLTSSEVFINYPAYTNLPTSSQTEMKIEALEGSKLTWKLEFDQELKNVMMEQGSQSYKMVNKDGAYYRSITLTKSGIYNFKYQDVNGNTFISDLYSIDLIHDNEPAIEVRGLDQYTSFNYDDSKNVSFSATITDDYGLSEAYIIATVSQGSGESVKFREERIEFQPGLKANAKVADLSKRINLDNMKMSLGDELYFYIEARDNKRPQSQSARSETFFVAIKDTTSYEFSVEGSLGVDVMPEYFRSQRQIIIDTEKLLKEKASISKEEFNKRSNELAFDQKALRLKYGQFLGEEAESGIAVSPEEQVEAMHNDEGKPLAGYMHDHDGGAEHEAGDHLQEESHHEEGKDHEHSENNLEAYTHDHDNAEEATFFTVSIKSKLRQALTEMWNSELYLRLFEPEKSLPYQHRALTLIKEIKNDARIYVHRIGFEPPPIKEKTRLSGDIKEVINHREESNLEAEDKYLPLRKALARARQLVAGKARPDMKDKQLFKSAGNSLAELAIDQPGRYLYALQNLKKLTEDASQSDVNKALRQLISDLQKIIPSDKRPSAPSAAAYSDLSKQMIEELKQLQND